MALALNLVDSPSGRAFEARWDARYRGEVDPLAEPDPGLDATGLDPARRLRFYHDAELYRLGREAPGHIWPETLYRHLNLAVENRRGVPGYEALTVLDAVLLPVLSADELGGSVWR